jgi:hypothetical protein
MSYTITPFYPGTVTPARSGWYLRAHKTGSLAGRIKLSYFDASRGKWGKVQSDPVVRSNPRGFRHGPSTYQHVAWCGVTESNATA